MPWIFPKNAQYEKANSKTFFYKFVERFFDKGFGNAWQLVVNKIYETQKTILCNSKQASMGVTKIKEVLKPLVNHHMIGMASKL
jgi:hypothetical protein